MVYLTGSHEVGRLPPCGAVRDGEGWPLLVNPLLRGCEAVTIDSAVGDVLFHHPCMVHYTTDAKPNASRAGYSMIYVAEDELLSSQSRCAEQIASTSPRLIMRARGAEK